jgi:hypothetical protein
VRLYAAVFFLFVTAAALGRKLPLSLSWRLGITKKKKGNVPVEVPMSAAVLVVGVLFGAFVRGSRGCRRQEVWQRRNRPMAK